MQDKNASTIRHLPFFVAIAEEGSLQKAAVRLNIVQPALSRRIHDLETELGRALFQRLPRGLRLSDAGRLLLEEGRRALDDYTRACNRARRAAAGEVGLIRVALTDAALQSPLVIGILKRFRGRYPEVTLQPVLMRSQSQLAALRAGQFDVGFMFLNPEERHEFAHRRIMIDDFVLALPASHRLASQATIAVADLREEALFWPTRTEARLLNDRMIAAFRAKGVSPHIVMEVMAVEQTLSGVAAGIGLGFVPLSQAFSHFPDVVFREVKDLSIPLNFEMVWRGSDSNRLVAEFVGCAEGGDGPEES